VSKAKKTVLLFLAAIVAAAAVFLIPTLWFKPWSINHFYTRFFAQYVLRHPMLLSSLGLLESIGLQFHNDDLDDFSVKFEVKEAGWIDRRLKILRSYDREEMDEEGGLSYDILEWYVADIQDKNRFIYHNYPVNQLDGIQSKLPDFMVNTHWVENLKGAEQYVARVSRFDMAFDQVLEGLELREKKGIVSPLFVIQLVLNEMKDFIAVEPSKNILYTHLESKLDELEGIKEKTREKLLIRAEQEIEDTDYPAYRRLIEFLTYQESIATTDDGVWKLPDGEAFYAYTLRHHTTTTMTADEIHNVGLREVERIQAEMQDILAAQGYPAGNLQAGMNSLNEQERFLYPDTDEGREQILLDYQAIIDEIDQGTKNFFDVRSTVGVKVERIPEFKQAKASGAYYDFPPMDLSRPGTFYVNLRDVKEIPKFHMRTIAYHEAIPGHHFQITIAQGLKDLPIFRRIIPFIAYGEGWALYAESLAAEQGYQENPYKRLGYLTNEIFRAVRLVVDTGIHAKRWTREQAIEYMLSNTGMPEGEVVAEIERYIVDPGVACAYKVGELKIVELRQRAMEKLCPDFNLMEFHNVILTNGAMPLTILEQQVDRWIASKLDS
jgi:uncharacterized protein (DUF885 family)